VAKNSNTERLIRLNGLVKAFYIKDYLTRDYILSELEYSTDRMIQRDLECLRYYFSMDIEYDRKVKGYRLKNRQGEYVMHLAMDSNEVTALSTGLNMVKHFIPPLSEECDGLWKKMGAITEKKLVDQGNVLAQSAVMGIPVTDVEENIFRRILFATHHREVITFDLGTPYKESFVRHYTISPWGIYFKDNSWYVWGVKHTKGKEVRNFRMSLVFNLNLLGTDDYMEISEEYKNLDLSSSTWFPLSGIDTTPVQIQIIGKLAKRIHELKLHPSQEIEQTTEGSYILRAEVGNINEVARWVLGNAPFARAISPTQLVGEIKELSDKIMAFHS